MVELSLDSWLLHQFNIWAKNCYDLALKHENMNNKSLVKLIGERVYRYFYEWENKKIIIKMAFKKENGGAGGDVIYSVEVSSVYGYGRN